MKVGVLFSGGIDSTLLIIKNLLLGNEIYPIYIKFGYQWEFLELYYVNALIKYFDSDLIKELKILNMSELCNVENKNEILNSQDNFLPMRNIMLLTSASFYLNSIGISFLEHGNLGFDNNSYPDSTEKYFIEIENLINIGLKEQKISIKTPFIMKNKGELLKHYSSKYKDKFKKEFPKDLIFSCATPKKNEMCGYCTKCKERKSTIKILNLKIHN